MGYPSAEEIKKDLGEVTKCFEKTQKEIEEIAKQEAALHELKRKLEKERDTLYYRVRVASEQLVVLRPISPELKRARSAVLGLQETVNSKDITISRREALEGELKHAMCKLQELCPHPFVFSYNGYGGSSMDDYDDAYRGWHVCVLCGLAEESQTSKEDVYTILIHSKTRLIKRDLRDEKKIGRAVWFSSNSPELLSLKEIRDVFFTAAGHYNLDR